MAVAFGKFTLHKIHAISVRTRTELTFCASPFVQRVWIALEAKGIQYQYIEVDPYKKPQSLLEVNPRGLVPAIRHGDWGCGESTVLMEYVSLPLSYSPILYFKQFLVFDNHTGTI